MGRQENYKYDLLVDSLKRGNEKTLEKLYQDMHQDLYYYAYTCLRNDELAKDVVQHVFLKLWDKRKGLGQIRSLKDYIFKIAKNTVFDKLRQKSFQSAEDIFLHEAAGYVHNETEEQIIYNDYIELAKEGISSLPPRRKEIFKLSRFENKSNKEISTELGISVNVVENQISQAIKQLKDYMMKYTDIAINVLLLLVVLSQT